MDNQKSHKAFKEKLNLPFQLLVDEQGKLTDLYDVAGGDYSKRVTYIIDKEGVICHIDDKVITNTHAQDILEKMS